MAVILVLELYWDQKRTQVTEDRVAFLMVLVLMAIRVISGFESKTCEERQSERGRKEERKKKRERGNGFAEVINTSSSKTSRF